MIEYIKALITLHTDDERGATAVEYGLMVALIAAVIVTAVALIGTNLDGLFDSVAGEVDNA